MEFLPPWGKKIHTFFRGVYFFFSAVQYGLNNEIETNTNVKDKEAFFRLFNMILWNAPELNDSQERQYFYRRQGLLGRPMPLMFHRQDNLGGSMYRSFVDQCYTLACKLGLSGLFSDLERFLY